MPSSATMPIRAGDVLGKSAPGARGPARVMVGSCLLILLAYTTATVFVQRTWALGSFEIGIFILVAVCLLARIHSSQNFIFGGVTQWFVYVIPAWGVLQIVARTTASTAETRDATLRWGALAGVFLLSQVAVRTREDARNMMNAFLLFATAMALLCLTQLFNSNGLVLWKIPSGYHVIYGTFQYSNNYSQFVELALPIAAWRAMNKGTRAWLYALSGGILFASVVAVAARMGTALCTIELLAIVAISVAQQRNPATRLPDGRAMGMVALVLVLAGAFTFAAGWQRVSARFQNDDFGARRDFLIAAVEMTKQHPVMGYGLDTYTEVFQRYTQKEFTFYANRAHNDWAEFAACGGIPFLLLVLIPFASAVPTALRHPWAVGLIAVMIHACVDYPFPRPAVSGWMFLMLGILFTIRSLERDHVHANAPTISVARAPVALR